MQVNTVYFIVITLPLMHCGCVWKDYPTDFIRLMQWKKMLIFQATWCIAQWKEINSCVWALWSRFKKIFW